MCLTLCGEELFLAGTVRHSRLAEQKRSAHIKKADRTQKLPGEKSQANWPNLSNIIQKLTSHMSPRQNQN